MEDKKSQVNIDDKLFLDNYNADKTSHLILKNQEACNNCEEKACTLICPARVYQYKDDKVVVVFEGCLECGACRITCTDDKIDWRYPRGGFGVQYRL